MFNKLTRRFPGGGRRTAIAYGGLTLALVATGTMAYGAIGPAEAGTASNSRVVTAQMGTVAQSVSATGNVQPSSTLNVGFATSGTVSEIDVSVGQQVQAGDVLAKLDPTAALINLNVAQLNLTAARAKLSSAQAGTSTSTGQGPATSGAVDASAVPSAQAGVLQAEAAVTAAQKALDDTTLTAPSAGTITALTGLVGQAVNGSGTSPASSSSGASGGGGGASGSNASSTSSASSNTAFITLEDLSTLVVKVGFAEIDAVKVASDQPATVTISALAGTPLSGTVFTVDPTATVVSNVVTYNAIVAITDPPATLKPGMTASVTVQVASHPNVLAVPTAAIETRGGASFVNVDVNGKPVLTPVTTGLQGDSTTEITSGVSEGQQLLVSTGTATTTAAATGTRGGGSFTGGAGGGFGGGGGGGFGGGRGVN
jgi:macrolide-specific efflux system membrane fusion protein